MCGNNVHNVLQNTSGAIEKRYGYKVRDRFGGMGGLKSRDSQQCNYKCDYSN